MSRLSPDDEPAPEMPPGVGDPGPRIINRFKRATAMYYKNSKRIICVAEDITDLRKAIAGLETKLIRAKLL